MLRSMAGSSQKEKPAGKGRKPPRGPKRVTPTYLENAALFYLGRTAASVAHFRRVLMNKVRRSASFHGTDVEEGAAIVEDLIKRYVRSGLLNDAAYAEAKVTQLHRKGLALRRIHADLRTKGVEAEAIGGAVAKLREGTAAPDLAAAIAYVRRRRLGPCRPSAERPGRHARDLAALARAGFSYEVAQKVLAAKDVEALEALREEEDA
ncbi:MAG: RecX family transcriptional regulator [Pseudomonadota bacterium]